MAPHDGAAQAEERSPLRLPNKIADSDPQKNQHIRKSIEKDVTSVQRLSLPSFLQNLSILTTLMPPHWKKLPPELKQFVEKEMFDPVMRQVLEDDNIINWAPSATRLYPLITTGDGNCLLHAVSLAMWGIEDDDLFLRKILHGALNSQDMESRRRWQKERKKLDERIPGSGLRYNTMEWRSEWEMVIKMASPKKKSSDAHGLPYESLEEFHIFMLANILRRPIIVMAQTMWHDLQGHSLQPQNFSGVYLPLKWKSEECIKQPIILGYYQMHFVPLVYTGVEAGEVSATEFVAPLIQQDHTPLPVHFLTEEEAGREDQLLGDYLVIEEVPHMDIDESMASTHVIKGAALSQHSTPDNMNLITSYFQLVESHYRYYLETEYNPTGTATQHQGGSSSQIESKLSKMNLTTGSQGPPGSDTWSPAANPNYKSASTDIQQGKPSKELPRFQSSAASDPERIMSMVNQSCKTKDCPYYRSISTGEYCHECYTKLKNFGEGKEAIVAKCRTEGCLNFPEPGQDHCHVCQASAKFQDNIGAIAPSAPLPSNISYPNQQGMAMNNESSQNAQLYQSSHITSDEDLTTLMVNTQKVGSKKCVMPECQLTGHPGMSDMCQKCFDENRRIHENVMSQASSAKIAHPQSQKPRVQNSAPVGDMYTSTTRECKTSGCHRIANSQLDYYCGECALEMSPVTPGEKPAYPTQVGTQPTIPPPSYNRALQMLQSNQRAAQASQPNQASGYAGPSSPQPQVPVVTVQKHICATPGCKGIRLEGGYCHECVVRNRLPMPRTLTPPPAPKHDWVQSKPRAQTPPITSARDQNQPSEFGYAHRNLPASSSYGSRQPTSNMTSSQLSTRTCRHPKCDRPAAPPKYILCEECIQIAELYKEEVNDDQQRPEAPNPQPPAKWTGQDQAMHSQPRPPREVGATRAYIPRLKCQARGGCKDGMYGDPELNNLCSTCFKESLMQPPFFKPSDVHSAPLRPSARTPHRQSSHSQVLPPKRKPENQPQERVFHMPSHTQAGFGNQVIIATGQTPAAVQVGQVPYVQKCATIDCQNPANPNILEGYCNHCYRAYKDVVAPSQPEPRIAQPRQNAPEQYSERPHRNQVPDPRQYHDPQPYPTGQTAKPFYDKPLDLPTPNQTRAPCKHSWCTNYGNPRCFGLCNECYKLTQLNRNGQIPQ